MEISATPRSYSLRLIAPKSSDKLESLWATHKVVNQGAQTWGDWLLTLRGGLSPVLAEKLIERRVLLALSWLSVETPEPLAPQSQIIARGTDTAEERSRKVRDRFRCILDHLKVADAESWLSHCEPALTARIRRDAVWVDRFSAFEAVARAPASLATKRQTRFLICSGARTSILRCQRTIPRNQANPRTSSSRREIG